MQTLEEYFAKRKKKDHMDEFDLNLHSENMSKAIQYVMDYFNEYLSFEEISQEQIKLQNAIDKIRDNIENVYPNQAEIIIEYYLKTKKRLVPLRIHYVKHHSNTLNALRRLIPTR